MIVTISSMFGGAMTLDESTKIEDTLKALGFPYDVSWEGDPEITSEADIEDACEKATQELRKELLKEIAPQIRDIKSALEKIEEELEPA